MSSVASPSPATEPWFGRMARSMRVRNFRLYFLGQFCSISGSNAQVVALGWLVLERTGSGAALGIVTAVQYIPLLVLGPLLGAFVNRSDERRLLIITEFVEMAIALILGFVALSDSTPIWVIATLAFILGVAYCFDFPARQLLIKRAVGMENLSNAVALHNVLFGASRTVGPAIAGILISQVGLAACFFANAASYILILVALYLMRPTELDDVAPRLTEPSSFLNGIRYVRRVPAVQAGLLIMAIVGTLTYEYWVTLPIMVREVFHRGAATYAAIISVMSVGTVIGGLFVATRRKVGRRDLFVMTTAYGITSILVGLSGSVFLMFVAALFMGFAYTGFVSVSSSVLQLNTDHEHQGLVMAIWTAGFVGSTAIGGPLMGAIAQHAGARFAIIIGGLSAIVAVLVGAVIWRGRDGQAETKPARLASSGSSTSTESPSGSTTTLGSNPRRRASSQ